MSKDNNDENGYIDGVPGIVDAVSLNPISLDPKRSQERMMDQTAQMQRYLDNGANPNAKDPKHGNTALMYTCYYGNYEAASALLNTDGVLINDTTNDGTTALICACSNASKSNELSLSIVKLLVEKGADINQQNTPENKPDKTALIVASELGNTEVVSLLLNTPNIELNVQDLKGNTALIYAISNPEIPKETRENIVKQLLEKGADTTLTNKAGKNAIMLARESNNPTVLNLLKTQVVNDAHKADGDIDSGVGKTNSKFKEDRSWIQK
jgi:ankyrin repeat protein